MRRCATNLIAAGARLACGSFYTVTNRPIAAVALLLWLGFAALTIAIFAVEGSTALAIPYPRLASIGVTVDLFIALALVSIWMYFDARKRGKSAIPFILMALVFGSLGPLTYLFLRLGD